MSFLNLKRRPFYYQTSSMDCGITCLKMICKFYKKNIKTKSLLGLTEIESVGVSMSGIKKTAEKIGFKTSGVILEGIEHLDLLQSKIPCLIHWNSNHFVVIYSIKKNKVLIGDPARGLIWVNKEEVLKRGFRKNPDTNLPEAYILLLEPTEKLDRLKEDNSSYKPKLDFILSHTKDKKIYFFVILFGLLAMMSAQFIMPFITKAIVDIGIKSGDLLIIKYLLLGQIVLIASKLIFDILRGWIVMHLSVRINYSLISKYLKKLFLLPIPFFEKRKIGDLLQRIRDHQRLEIFITRSILNIFISILTIIIFSSVLFIYNKVFFYFFLIATILYITWILFFLNARKKIDWERFEINSKNQTILVQIISGIQDLKIYNSYNFLFDKWKNNQEEYIKTSFKTLKLNQLQETGASFIYQLAQTAIIFYAAKLILNNQLSLGAMLSIEFIIGQLVSPVQQILSSVMFGVEAKLSFDRIFELWDTDNEKGILNNKEYNFDDGIEFKNVSFKHPGQESNFTIKNLNISIKKGETIAIVGSSGSGKTTILKLLLGYYEDYNGAINIGKSNFNEINIESWRDNCGVVLQDNYIFNDTIAKNIALSDTVDKKMLFDALKIANIDSYVNSLPLKHDTVIGKDGKGISQGQKQRMLIARAVYKNPSLLMLDEATNALDADNEMIIMDNLKKFSKDKTVLIVAHRLSTVQFADKILVFDEGEIVEEGNHKSLIEKKGKYFSLVKRQLYKY